LLKGSEKKPRAPYLLSLAPYLIINKYGARDNKYGAGDNKYGARLNKYVARLNKYGPRLNKYGTRLNKYGASSEKIGVLTLTHPYCARSAKPEPPPREGPTHALTSQKGVLAHFSKSLTQEKFPIREWVS
jgi:hypothetical protein